MNRKLNIETLAAALLLALSAPVLAGDLVADRLVSAKIAGEASLDRAPARLAWALEDSELQSNPTFVAESREFATELDAATLSSGWQIPLTARGAVVRVTPFGGEKSLALDSIEIRHGGAKLALREASANMADAGQLRAAGMDFPDGSVAFKLKPELGSSGVALAVVSPKASRYVVHVFEPESTEVLILGADRSGALSGQALNASVSFASGSAKRLGQVTGLLVSPDGRSEPIDLSKGANGTFSARFVPSAAATSGGLWELHVFATSSDGTVQRDAKTAFAVALPRARTTGKLTLASARDGVIASIPVEAVSASRYDVSAVLYGTNSDGRSMPVAIAHSGTWLEPGTATLTLHYPAEIVTRRGFRGPFTLRQLTLTDHAQQAVIEKRLSE